MGGKGKSGPVATNDALVQMQMQQAAEAKQANIERTARLQQGADQIAQIFGGHPADATQLNTASLLETMPTNIPDYAQKDSGFFSNGQFWNDTTKQWEDAGTEILSAEGEPSGYTWGQLPSSGGATQYGIWDPEGTLVTSAGSPEELSQRQIWYGGTGPNVDPFQSMYDDFKKATLDYYMPQEREQYADARSKLAYNLARAGQLNSSTADMDVAKLAKQDEMNVAQIASQADTQTANFRKQVEDARQVALNQLYSTEDPTVAANTAQNMVANAQLTVPDLNPAGALFAPITVGVGNAISGFMNPYAQIASSSQSPTPRSPDQSSGSTGFG